MQIPCIQRFYISYWCRTDRRSIKLIDKGPYILKKKVFVFYASPSVGVAHQILDMGFKYMWGANLLGKRDIKASERELQNWSGQSIRNTIGPKKKKSSSIRIMLSKIKIMDSPIKAPTSNQIQNKNATSRISWLSYCSSNHIRPIIPVNLISRALLAHIELPSIQLL